MTGGSKFKPGFSAQTPKYTSPSNPTLEQNSTVMGISNTASNSGWFCATGGAHQSHRSLAAKDDKMVMSDDASRLHKLHLAFLRSSLAAKHKNAWGPLSGGPS